MSSIPLSQLSIPCASTPPIIDEPSSTISDPLQIGLNSVACGSFQGSAAMESEVLTFMMDHVMVCPVNTIAHVPRSVRPLLARVLSVELRKACSSFWAFVRLTTVQLNYNFTHACRGGSRGGALGAEAPPPPLHI